MWFNDIDILQQYPSGSHPPGGVAPTRRALAVHACRKHQAAGGCQDDAGARPDPRLHESDAIWIRRGQSLGTILLTNRRYAAVGWAAALMLAGGSLVLLALLGVPETGMNATTNTVPAAPP